MSGCTSQGTSTSDALGAQNGHLLLSLPTAALSNLTCSQGNLNTVEVSRSPMSSFSACGTHGRPLQLLLL